MAAPAPGRLPLPDELLLLALDDERGTRSRASELEPGLGGAVLLDLALQHRLDVAERRVVVVDPTPTGDEVLDRVLSLVAREPRPRRAKHWVSAAQKGTRAAVADRLVAAGTLVRDERRVLGIFPVTRLPAGDPSPESEVRARLDAAVLGGSTPDDRTAALAALVHAVGLQRAVFPTGDRRTTRARLEELAEGEWAADAVRQVVREAAGAAAAAAAAAGGAATAGS